MPLLKVSDLTTGVAERLLIRKLNFEIHSAAFIAVLGYNGCGKSTFFRSLLNLHPFSGNVLFENRNLKDLSRSELTKTVALLEQKNYLTFDILVKDLVVMGTFQRKTLFESYTKQDFEDVECILNGLQIGHLYNTSVTGLSGGELQLVWLAQVLIQNTQFLLLDEPTQQLDVYNRKLVFDSISSLVKERNKTVVCITHDIYNLYEMEGYFINLSLPSPGLLPITKDNLDAQLGFLQEGKQIYF